MIAPIMIVALGICIFFFVVWIFRWLWNITMPQVFNFNEITYWQAFRLLLIAAMVFGGPNLPGASINI